MAPELFKVLGHCRDRLSMTEPVELFLINDANSNAFAMRDHCGPPMVVLSSRLIETFSLDELSFVIGHELGHVCCDHLSIPMPHTATIEEFGGRLVPRGVALKLFYWSRAAEISADRAGLLCAGDMDVAGRTFFKIVSGLSSTSIVKPDLDELRGQLDLMVASPAALRECHLKNPRTGGDHSFGEAFSTHPFSPMRLRALLAYARSEPFHMALDLTMTGDLLGVDTLEQIVEQDLEIMSPSYLEENTAHAGLLRRILFAAAMCVAGANGEVDEAEALALRALLGSNQPTHAGSHGDVRSQLATLMLEVSDEIPTFDRVRLLEHVTIIAGGDGVVDELELAELLDFSRTLGVAPIVVEQVLMALSKGVD